MTFVEFLLHNQMKLKRKTVPIWDLNPKLLSFPYGLTLSMMSNQWRSLKSEELNTRAN